MEPGDLCGRLWLSPERPVQAPRQTNAGSGDGRTRPRALQTNPKSSAKDSRATQSATPVPCCMQQPVAPIMRSTTGGRSLMTDHWWPTQPRQRLWAVAGAKPWVDWRHKRRRCRPGVDAQRTDRRTLRDPHLWLGPHMRARRVHRHGGKRERAATAQRLAGHGGYCRRWQGAGTCTRASVGLCIRRGLNRLLDWDRRV